MDRFTASDGIDVQLVSPWRRIRASTSGPMVWS